MRIMGISHIGIASKDPRKTAEFFDKILSLPLVGEELVLQQKTNTIMFESASGEALSQPRLEVLEPHNNSGPVQGFIEKKGGGIHHIALQVECVQSAIDHMLKHSIEMVDESPREGAHQTKVAFVHPRATGGVLIELVEEKAIES